MNVETFWSNVQRTVNKKSIPTNLIFEKKIFLNENVDDDECRESTSVIVLGINPHDRLSTSGRIEVRSATTKTVLRMNKETLIDLLESINDRFREDAVTPKQRKISIRSINEILFEIKAANEVIKMSLNTLLTLRDKLPIIKLQIDMLERVGCSNSLFNLLHHFCYDAEQNAVMRAMHNNGRDPTIDKRQLIIELCQIDCECLEKSFVLEIANGYLDWFVTCVPQYIKAIIQQQEQDTLR